MRFLLAFLLIYPAHAIVWRADLRTLPTAQMAEMKQVGKVFYSPLKVFGGSCYALGGRWVLTCRHGTDKWSASMLKVQFPALGKEILEIQGIVFPAHGDFALLELAKPLKSAKAPVLFVGKATPNQRAWLGGFGKSGPVGQLDGNGEFHAGHNRVDGIRNNKVSLTLGQPDDPSTEPDEASLAIFDSGSPLFLEVEGKWRLAGIASTASNGSNPGYGDRANYARISTVVGWIRKLTGE
ncbi:MAG: hypothetical protein ACON5H_03800 [Akkermansiaceae bacterium]